MRVSLRRREEPVPRPMNCLNCGVAIPPENVYCGQCGQENEASPVSFGALVREAWEEFIKVDVKLLSTLRLLLFRPGYLTGEYVRGRRAAYLSPFKMYITVSALFLLVPFDKVNDWDEQATKLDQQILEAQKKANTESKKRESVRSPKSRSATSNKLCIGICGGSIKQEKSLKGGVDDAVNGWKSFRSSPIRFFGRKVELEKLPQSVTKYRDEQATKPVGNRDSPFKHYFTERMIRFKNDPGESAKNLFSTGLPFLLLIQLPLFAIWMRMIYFRQRRLYVEHLVFLLHTHTFFFLLFGIILAADAVAQVVGKHLPMLDVPTTWILLTVIVTFYNLLAYRRFYGQGWGKTVVKGWFLLHGYLFLLIFTVVISAMMAILCTVFIPT